MANLSGWLATLIGVLWILPLLGVNIGILVNSWLIGLAILAIGITKLTGSE